MDQFAVLFGGETFVQGSTCIRYYCLPLQTVVEGVQAGNWVGKESSDERQKDTTKKEDRTRHLPRPERVLDHPDTILAVGARGRRRQDPGQATNGDLFSRAPGTDGADQQYGPEPCASESHARGAVISPRWIRREVIFGASKNRTIQGQPPSQPVN